MANRNTASERDDTTQRLDRWLWAARFFKTRSSAGAAVSGGRVSIDGTRPKPARKIAIGTVLVIERGPVSFEVVVHGLNEQRRPAPEAQQLYQETERSIARRNEERSRLEQAAQRRQKALGRPARDERRQLSRLKGRT